VRRIRTAITQSVVEHKQLDVDVQKVALDKVVAGQAVRELDTLAQEYHSVAMLRVPENFGTMTKEQQDAFVARERPAREQRAVAIVAQRTAILAPFVERLVAANAAHAASLREQLGTWPRVTDGRDTTEDAEYARVFEQMQRNPRAHGFM
jgi:hypothetical protein